MPLLLLCLLLVSTCTATTTTRVLTQRVDHFDPLGSATFSQNYIINDAYIKNKTTIESAFIENDIRRLRVGELGCLIRCEISRFIEAHVCEEAVLIALELRYTGQSFPLPKSNQSGDVTWLRYNTIEQTHADILFLQQVVGPTYNDAGPHHNWIFVGHQSTGSLAIWFRHEALSVPASRRLCQLSISIYFTNDVAYSITTLDTSCSSKLASSCASALRRVVPLLEKIACGCADSLSDFDFIHVINSIVCEMALVDSTNLCRAAANGTADAVAASVQAWLATHTSSCDNFTLTRTPDVEARFFVQCKQTGGFSVSAGKNGIMSPSLNTSWYTQECANLFGAPFQVSDLQYTTFTYGSNANTLLIASNVIYVTSPMDAFHPLQLWANHESNTSFPNQRLLTLESVSSETVLAATVSNSDVVKLRNKLLDELQQWLSETSPSHPHDTLVILLSGCIIAVVVFGGAFGLFAYFYKKRQHHYHAVEQMASLDPDI